MTEQEKILNQIDSYNDTIFALLGLTSLFKYDEKKGQLKDYINVYQGFKFNITDDHQVTPDLAIYGPNLGIVSEVKISFPKDETFWDDDFKQLKNYDNELIGWPTDNLKFLNHQIVLILHQSRTIAVKKFIERKSIVFNRNFSIIECNRIDQRKTYMFFRFMYGKLTGVDFFDKLENGISIEISKLSETFSVKLYDSEPPLPYLMQLIWEHIVIPEAIEILRNSLKKQNKILVELKLNDITRILEEGFSFRILKENSDRQPKVPKQTWVTHACTKFVESDEAEWIGSGHDRIRFFFQRYEDVLQHFINICSDKSVDNTQLEIFN